MFQFPDAAKGPRMTGVDLTYCIAPKAVIFGAIDLFLESLTGERMVRSP